MTTTATTWTRERAGFYRSADMRFDVWLVTLDNVPAYWLALDGERPRKERFADLETAIKWCEQRAGAK